MFKCIFYVACYWFWSLSLKDVLQVTTRVLPVRQEVGGTCRPVREGASPFFLVNSTLFLSPASSLSSLRKMIRQHSDALLITLLLHQYYMNPNINVTP